MKIGWIGTGVMGASMAGHLLDAGHELAVYNRTRSKAESLLSRGARWCDGPADVAGGVDAVGVIVGFPRDVEQVILEPGGVLETLPTGSLLIDFTTSRPELARHIHREAAGRGIAALDAPVSGGDVGARQATLSIMTGGDTEAFERARPLLETLGRTVVHQGPAGSGQHTKMVNQVLIASTMIGVCEGLLYAREAGLDPRTVLESVGGGAAASWSLTHLYPRLLDGDLEPGFFVEHFVKDMGIALEACADMGLQLPGLELAERLYRSLVAAGHEKKGTQALLLALEALQTSRPDG